MIVNTRPEFLIWNPRSDFHINYRRKFRSSIRKRMDNISDVAYQFSRFASKSSLVTQNFQSRVSYIEGIVDTCSGPEYRAWNQIDQWHLGFAMFDAWAYRDILIALPLVFCKANKIDLVLPLLSGFERRKRFAEHIWRTYSSPEFYHEEVLELRGVSVEDSNWELDFQLNLCAIARTH